MLSVLYLLGIEVRPLSILENSPFLFQFFELILATIDINLAQFQYLADHLSSNECRRLVASLHFDSFELPNALDQAERSVSKDINCLEQLLHWNSETGGGRAETHELVARRLRQLDREDLGEWLSRTSYEAIGHDFDRESKEAFKPYEPIVLPQLNLSSISTAIHNGSRTTLPIDRFAHRRIAKQDFVPTIATDIATDPTEWTIFDTISWTLVVMMFLFIIGLMIYLTITSPCCKNHICENWFSRNKKYKKYECLQCEEDDYYDRSTRRSNDTRSTPVCPRTGGTCPRHSRPKRSQDLRQQHLQQYHLYDQQPPFMQSERRQSSQNDLQNVYNKLSPYHQQIPCPPCVQHANKKKSSQPDNTHNKPFNKLSSYQQQIPPCPPCQLHSKRQSNKSHSSAAGASPSSSDTEYEEASCPNICPALELMGCDMPHPTKHLEGCPNAIPHPPPCLLPNPKKDLPSPVIKSATSGACSSTFRTIDIHQKIAIPMGPVPS